MVALKARGRNFREKQMASILLTGPAVEPITLAEVRSHLRVQHDDDDDIFSALIAGARVHIETQTRRALINQSWRLTRDVRRESDGRTYHALVRFRAVTEPSA